MREVAVFRNGEKLSTLTYGSQLAFPSATTLSFNLNPLGSQFTFSLYRLRLSQSLLMLSDAFFKSSYLDGSNSR